jgi:hypothetical protein
MRLAKSTATPITGMVLLGSAVLVDRFREGSFGDLQQIAPRFRPWQDWLSVEGSRVAARSPTSRALSWSSLAWMTSEGVLGLVAGVAANSISGSAGSWLGSSKAWPRSSSSGGSPASEPSPRATNGKPKEPKRSRSSSLAPTDGGDPQRPGPGVHRGPSGRHGAADRPSNASVHSWTPRPPAGRACRT